MIINEPDTPFWVSTLFDRLDTMRQEINARLDHINGTVRRHDQEIHLLKENAHMPESCATVADLVIRVNDLERSYQMSNEMRRRLWKSAAAIGAIVAGVSELVFAFFRR